MDAREILLSITRDTDLVRYHPHWGYYIQVPFGPIKKIGLIDKGSTYELQLLFGDSQAQSKALYSSTLREDVIDELIAKGWNISPNFHVSSSFGRNLVWFDTRVTVHEYVSFWRKNLNLLSRLQIEKLDSFLATLTEKGIIRINEKKRAELQRTIFDSDYSRINIGAGLGVTFQISEELMKSRYFSDQLHVVLTSKINEGLQLIGQSGESFLRDFDQEEPMAEMGDPPGPGF